MGGFIQMEEWRSIPESSHYKISNYGRMINVKTGKILTIQKQKANGKKRDNMVYVIYDKKIQNKKHLIRRSVSIAVMQAFRPDIYTKGKPIYRKDGNIYNNKVSNFVYYNVKHEESMAARNKLFNRLYRDWVVKGSINYTSNTLSIKHKKCGNTFLYKVSSVIKNKKPICPYCNKNSKDKLIKRRKQIEYNKYLGRYTFLGEGNKNSPFLLYDEKYGNYFQYKSYADLANSHSMIKSPFDKKMQSIPESMIEYMLQLLGLPYYWQYFINDCRDTLPLPFDFAIKNTKGNLLFLIEYQGEQHNGKGSNFGKKGSLTARRYIHHDAIKAEYCKKHNIPILYLSGYNYNKMYQCIIDELNIFT